MVSETKHRQIVPDCHIFKQIHIKKKNRPNHQTSSSTHTDKRILSPQFQRERVEKGGTHNNIDPRRKGAPRLHRHIVRPDARRGRVRECADPLGIFRSAAPIILRVYMASGRDKNCNNNERKCACISSFDLNPGAVLLLYLL